MPPKVTITIETITPDVAEEWVKHCIDNRPIRPDRVNRYARDMLAREWRLTGDPIRWNGEIIVDGEHRLRACIQAGVPLVTAVARGVETEARAVMDTGATRTLPDYLRWRHEPNAHLLSAMLGVVWKYDNSAFLDPRKTPTRNELLHLLDNNASIRASVPLGRSTARSTKIPPSVCGGAHYLFARKATEEEATSFMYLLRTEGAAEIDTGPFVLRRYAVRNAMAKTQRPTQAEWMALTIKAFNYWMAGAPIKHLRWRRGGSQAEPFPSIVPEAFVGEDEV